MNIVFKNEIISMSILRYKLIEQLHQIGDDDGILEKELNEEIDELSEKIKERIIVNYERLPFEFIMEELSKLGQCPNLLYDDNGNWAVTDEGFQNIAHGDEPIDIETHFFIKAELWKPTPREALKYYLTHEEE